MRGSKGSLWGMLVILIFITAATFILISSGQKEVVRSEQVGCYEGSPGDRRIVIDITSDGLLESGDVSIPVHLRRDKYGISFEPEQRLLINDDRQILAIMRGHPDLLRIGRDRSFTIPTDSGALIKFAPC